MQMRRQAKTPGERIYKGVGVACARRLSRLSCGFTRAEKMNLKERTYLWYIAVLRVYIGYYLLFQGIRKYQRDFPKGDWIGRQIGDLAAVDLYPWYKTFLRSYVLPHSELFGNLVMAGEILVGGCLLLGLLTRFSAGVGLFMLINY